MTYNPLFLFVYLHTDVKIYKTFCVAISPSRLCYFLIDLFCLLERNNNFLQRGAKLSQFMVP